MMELQNLTLIISITICVIAFIPSIRSKIKQISFTKKFDSLIIRTEEKFHYYFVVLIMLIGSSVRLWKFGIIPGGFNQDGAMGAVDALALAQHGTDRFGMWLPVHFTAWGFTQMSVLLSYLSVPFIWIFGLNRYTARAPIVIISLLALWVLYLLCKLVFGRKAAMIILAFGSINPWQIMQSRWALDCNPLPHFLLFSVYFLILGLNKNKKFMYLSMIFFGITMYTYGIAWYSIPLFLIMGSIYLISKKVLTLIDLAGYGITYLFVAWPILGVMIINFFKLPTLATPLFTIPYFPSSSRAGDLLFFSNNFLKQLISNIEAIINSCIIQKPDLPWNSIPEYGTLYLFSIPILIAGLFGFFRMIKTKKLADGVECKKADDSSGNNRYLYFPIIAWLVTALASGLIVNNVNVNRINIIFYPLIILCGLGIFTVVKRIKFLGLFIMVIYTLAFSGFIGSYFGEHSKVIAKEFYGGFGEAMEYVKNLDYNKIYVTNWTQGQNSWRVSETLVLFHHQIDALYYQGKKDTYSNHGKKLLPYKERYKYVQISQLKINPNEKAVYVVQNNEVDGFDKGKFNIYNFAYYDAVVPKK